MPGQLCKFTIPLAVLLFVLSPICTSTPPPLTITFAEKVPKLGTLDVKIFQSLELFYRGEPIAATNIPLSGEMITIIFPEIPDGRYLVSVLHDANNDGRMNANAFGIPTESSIFYTPHSAAGPVRPRDAFFDLDARHRDLSITLPPPPADPRAWGAGAMMILSSNPYRGGDTVVRVFPSLTFVGEHFFIVGPRAGYNLFRNQWFNANIVADVKFAGEAFEEEKFLEGMAKRRDTVMAGFDTSLRVPGPYRLEFSAMTDVLDRHNGQEAQLSLARNWRGKRWTVTPSIGLVWRSGDYNDYYFGVRDNEATDERPAYDPGDSVEFFTRLFSRLELSESWSVLAAVRLEFLSNAVHESPIVDKHHITSAFLGLTYAF
jgi:outer membrane protein